MATLPISTFISDILLFLLAKLKRLIYDLHSVKYKELEMRDKAWRLARSVTPITDRCSANSSAVQWT